MTIKLFYFFLITSFALSNNVWDEWVLVQKKFEKADNFKNADNLEKISFQLSSCFSIGWEMFDKNGDLATPPLQMKKQFDNRDPFYKFKTTSNNRTHLKKYITYSSAEVVSVVFKENAFIEDVYSHESRDERYVFKAYRMNGKNQLIQEVSFAYRFFPYTSSMLSFPYSKEFFSERRERNINLLNSKFFPSNKIGYYFVCDIN